MPIRDWYPRTFRESPLPEPVARANGLRWARELARDREGLGALLTQLSEFGHAAADDPDLCRDSWLAWAAQRRAAVRSTLGEIPLLTVDRAELSLPVQREAAGIVRTRLLTLTGAGCENRLVPVTEVVPAGEPRPRTALLVLPDLEVTLGTGRRGSPERWGGLAGTSAALVTARFAVLERASTAWVKRWLLEGTTFISQLLAEIAGVADWLAAEAGYASVVVAGEGHAGLVSLLAGAILPGIAGCVVRDSTSTDLWPTEHLMLLPESRRILDVATLAALVPPNGLLVVASGSREAMAAPLEAARWSARFCCPVASEEAPQCVCSAEAYDSEAFASWVRALEGTATSEGRPAPAGRVRFPNMQRAFAAAGLRDRFITALGGFPARTEMEAWSRPLEHGEFDLEEVFFRGEPDVVVPGLFAKPRGARGRLPVVLCLPGSSATAENVAVPWGRPLLEEGFGVFAVDVKASRFGKRGQQAAAETIARGTSTLGQMTYDLVRAIDYLETREDVDTGKIGCFGISIGGTQTWLLAAADERVKVAAPVVGISTYDAIARCIRDESIDSSFMSCLDSHSIYYYVPGLLELGDQPEFASLIAPRPLCVLATSRDNCFPLEGVEEAMRRLRKAYEASGAADRLGYQVAEGPHAYPVELQEGVRTWMKRWL
ncbi:MAG: hypothetical protein HPY83_11115 [Anaerolineae bacterium]|nr:hypothetical protein [Anaerolineae bacterium]